MNEPEMNKLFTRSEWFDHKGGKWCSEFSRPEPNLNALQYCQKYDLRILASHAFDFFYRELQHHPGNYLEIGCFEGFMLRELAKAYPDKYFYGVDPFIEDGHTWGHQTEARAGEAMVAQRTIARTNVFDIPNAAIIEECSKHFAYHRDEKDLAELDVSCVFIDGNHSYDFAHSDCYLAFRLLVKGGVIFIDDTGTPDVLRAVKEFVDREKMRVSFTNDDNSVVRIRPLVELL